MAGMDRPAILVPDLESALAAADAAARTGIAVALLSEKDCALAAGVGWFGALVRAARGRAPVTAVAGILDCGDRPDHVQAAFREGLDAVFRGPARIAEKLESIAGKSGRSLFRRRPRALKIGDPRDPDAIAAALRRAAS